MAVLLATTLVVSGCGGGGKAEADPSPIRPSSSAAEPSRSESEPAGEAPPEMPAAARESSLAGSEAFVGHWADLVTYTLQSGDTRPIE